ncbi:MAG: hypothetical protein ACYTAS_24485 [Planctomycetota bacterium]|jgi:hypothetical protein
MKKVGNAFLLALSLLALLAVGCARHVKTPLARAAPPLRTAPTWSPQVEGLQCRLRPTKRLWNSGETITFKLDLRNHGTRLFAFNSAEPLRVDRISVDGRWHRWPRPHTAPASIRPLAPGTELSDLTLALPRTVRLPLNPGRHDVRVAFLFEDLEVRSHPVRIEIAGPPQEPAQ